MAVDQFVERGLKPSFDVGFQQQAIGLIGHSLHVSRRVRNRTGKGAFSQRRLGVAVLTLVEEESVRVR